MPFSPGGLRPERILVTDAETRAALAAVRSLGRAGHEIHTTCARPRGLASASRFVRAEHVLPDAERAPDAWAAALEALCRAVRFDRILPIAELSLGALYAAGLDARLPCLAPSAAAYSAATDKHGILEIARQVGIRVPKSVLVESPASLAALPAGFVFPLILKARRSRFRAGAGWGSGAVVLVRDADEVARAVRDPGFAQGLLVQEFLPGHGEGIFLLARAGECLAAFAHRRLREKPPSGGVSVLREAVEPDPRLLAASQALIARLGLDGVAMVEFRCPPGEEPALMEINPRLWGSLQLAIDAGIDFPELLWRMHAGLPLPKSSARPGVRTRWLLGDFDHLLIALKRRDMREATGRTRRAVVLDFLRSFGDGSRLEVLRSDDPRPFLRELRLWLRL
ncbi:ATP-grasp domain-containing protein [Myxococcota bacterium]|nr:ATP-grasp domain-containing protein [Myxococcota bacterium]